MNTGSYIILPACKKNYPKFVGCKNKRITEYNPKGLSAKQLGLKPYQYKAFCNRGVIIGK